MNPGDAIPSWFAGTPQHVPTGDYIDRAPFTALVTASSYDVDGTTCIYAFSEMVRDSATGILEVAIPGRSGGIGPTSSPAYEANNRLLNPPFVVHEMRYVANVNGQPRYQFGADGSQIVRIPFPPPDPAGYPAGTIGQTSNGSIFVVIDNEWVQVGGPAGGVWIDYVENVCGIYATDSAAWVDVPASSTAPGLPGELAYDDDFIYCCVDVDTWKRVALSTW